MQNEYLTSAMSEQDIIAMVDKLKFKDNPVEYNAILVNDHRNIQLHMEVDVGGGFQTTLDITRLKAIVDFADNFTFSIKNKTIFDQIKSLLGFRYIKSGIKQLDKHAVMRSTNTELFLDLIDDPKIAEVLCSLNRFSFCLSVHKAITNKHHILEFNITDVIGKPAEFKDLYRVFNILLSRIDSHYINYSL